MEYIIQMFKLILVLAIFVVAAYYVIKQMKKKQLTKISSNRMIQVIDGVQIGMRDEVVLMKVGKEYILMSASSGQMLALKQEVIEAPEADFDDLFAKESPTLALKGIVKGLKDGVMKK